MSPAKSFWPSADRYSEAMQNPQVTDVFVKAASPPAYLDQPEFEKFVAWTTPLAPTTPEQIRTVAEQWEADLDFDGLDRIEAITAPTLVLTGERDIVTPPRHGRAVAERIPAATFELMTGVGASHGLLFERTDDFVRTVLTFLEQQSLA